jgi:hypothetical protein
LKDALQNFEKLEKSVLNNIQNSSRQTIQVSKLSLTPPEKQLEDTIKKLEENKKMRIQVKKNQENDYQE